MLTRITSSEVVPIPTADLLFGLRYKDTLVVLPVGEEQEKPLTEFKHLFTQHREQLTGLNESPVALVLEFLAFLVDQQCPQPALTSLFASFETKYLINHEIHSLVADASKTTEEERRLLRMYYLAQDSASATPLHNESALFSVAGNSQSKYYAVFGGQGNGNAACFSDFADLFSTYEPLLRDLVDTAASVLSYLCRLPDTSSYFRARHIDLKDWLAQSDRVPAADYIASAPVSFPIIGLLGLAHYCVTCKVLGYTPGEMQSKFQGATGHSQGLVVAAAIAGSVSWDSFYENAKLAIKILFWIGYYCHQEAPGLESSASVIEESLNHQEGYPSCLLSVRGLGSPQLQSLLEKTDETLPTRRKIYLGLINSHESHVVSGPAKSLACLNAVLRELKAGDDLDQVRIPYGQRKPSVHHRFLPVSAPFHSIYLKGAAQAAKSRLSSESFALGQSTIPVYHTASGLDVAQDPARTIDITIDAICHELMDWPNTLRSLKATHIVAFGGNELGDLITMNTDGHGVRVVLSGILGSSTRSLGTRRDIFNPQPSLIVTRSSSWREEFRPRLRISTDGQLMIDTKLSRLLGVPPLITAGMTPTTVPWDFVAAVTNAGYHTELAAGGYYNADSMSTAISKIIENVTPGRSITCNMIYASPHAIAWQIPLLRRLIRNGLPIEGLTVGAGIPSATVASQYITSLGLRHISLKPGSYAGILEVLEIAKAHPEFPIILQWTGGRGGGHHSYEDFHAPILSSYGMIRKHFNVILVAGSGFGDAKGTYPYLSGTWSVQFGRPAMPFDGILLGSRMMVSKESHTAPQAKELILNAKGVPDSEWQHSYKKPTGGIITVRSEMGQPIHKIATRAVLLWSELDSTIFSLPRKQRLAAILEKKEYIIHRLNEDFAKPWFGQKMDGTPTDLPDMTYEEVFTRLISLMFVRRQTRWVDTSYAALVYDVMERALSRSAVHTELYGSDLRKDPVSFLQKLLHVWPGAKSIVIHPEDCSWFLRRCRVRGQKPVNFVPVFDDDFEQWFKKDSLWQSEDVDAVINQDVQRVCVLHGPVAAQYSQSRDESVKDILDGINTGLIQMIQQDHSIEMRTKSESGTSSWQSCSPVSETEPPAISVAEQSDASTLTTISQFDSWRLSPSVVQPMPPWIHAVIAQDFLLQGPLRIPNPLRKLLGNRTEVEVHTDHQNKTITVSELGKMDSHTEIRVTMTNMVDIKVELKYSGSCSSSVVILPFYFQLRINGAIYSLEEIMADRAARIKTFYSNLWLGKDVDHGKTVNSTFYGKEVTLTRQLLQDIIRATTHTSHRRDSLMPKHGCFPINACVILAWDVLVEPLVVPDIDGDLLRLVHESVNIQYVSDAASLQVDDIVSSRSRITQVHVEEAGKHVTVEAQLIRSGKSVVTVTSTFLFRGMFTNFVSTFRSTKEPDMVLDIISRESAALLQAREWFKPTKSSLSLVGQTLQFRLRTTVRWASKDIFSHQSVQGNVYALSPTGQLEEIGVVQFEASDCVGNPIMDYLSRRGKLLNTRKDLDYPGWAGTNSHVVNLPDDNELYGQVSRDSNPIHSSPIFSTWAGLDQPIVHGMYTTAITAAILEFIGCDGDRSRIRKLVTSYTSMGFASEAIRIRLRHTAMFQGRMLFELEAVKQKTGDIILRGEAEVEQISTVYLFTGQGSQSKGMGMQLYERSSVARQVWDRVDKYLFGAYGWSILHIVRDNPKTLTVHFGGQRGRVLRKNYLQMTIETVNDDGTTDTKPILRGLTAESRSYTFSDDRGLVFSTQFAQPAILLLENAIFEDMRMAGLVQDGASFAGHSLGEYGCLSAVAGFMPLEKLMDVVFYRGLTMQVAMDRDEAGRTDYAMVAVSPRRVGLFFDEHSLRSIVNSISKKSVALLEIVNFNVEGEQYVCAGSLRNLHVLSDTLDYLYTSPDNHELLKDFTKRLDSIGIRSRLEDRISASLGEARELPRPIELTRGRATIPLEGIDVPFHSTYLRPGVHSYRKFLESRMVHEDLEPERLVGKFVPNIMAHPFSLDRAYVEEAFLLTGSPVLKDILDSYQFQ